MPEDIKQNTPQEQATPATDESNNKQDQPIHVRNPFTGKEVDITQEQLDSIEKGIEAQTERD